MLVRFTDLNGKFPIYIQAGMITIIQPIPNHILGSHIITNLMTPKGYSSFEVAESIDSAGGLVNAALAGKAAGVSLLSN